jgi:uncharacterized membrane protein YgdD (TMEM256/DUF423 family)
MTPNWISIGAFGAALAVICGAFGAHALADRLDAHHLTLWETAARYLMYGAFSLVLLGLAARGADRGGLGGFGGFGGFGAGGWCLALGTLVFSGTVASLALGGPRWLGAITPLGGLLMIAGLALFGWAALRV